MNAIDLKRAEFRHFLETSGVLDALNHALIKLYDEIVKPNDPVAYVRQHFKRPTDENGYFDGEKRFDDFDAAELIEKQKRELDLARLEIAKLRQTLDLMEHNSSGRKMSLNVTDGQTNAEYHSIFGDPKYDGTLIKKYLTEDLFNTLQESRSKATIIDLISNVNSIGLLMLNGDCYSKFSVLIEPILKEIHKIEIIEEQHPDSDFGDFSVFESLQCEAIEFIEISCNRSIENFDFIPGMNEQDLENVLTMVQNAIQSSQTDDNEIDGEFFKITDVKETEPIFDELQKNGIGFRSINAQDHRLWPIGRGLYVNCAHTQSILINEEDHLRFICKEKTNEFGLIYKNLVALIHKMGNNLSYNRNERYGWLTVNPFDLGSAIHCRVRMHFNEQICIDSLKEICEKLDIQIEVVDDCNECTVDFVNDKVFGFSEFDCMKTFYDSMKEIIETMEKGAETAVLENDDEKYAVPDSEMQEQSSNDKMQDIETVSVVENVEIQQTIEEELNGKTNDSADDVEANNDDKSQDEKIENTESNEPTNVVNDDSKDRNIECNNENAEPKESFRVDDNLNDGNEIENSEKNYKQIECSNENAENNENNGLNDAQTVNADENGNASEINQTES